MTKRYARGHLVRRLRRRLHSWLLWLISESDDSRHDGNPQSRRS
jgi:hypothetical protein